MPLTEEQRTAIARALVHLLEGLGAHNVLLNCPGATLDAVAANFVSHLVGSSTLPAAAQDRVVALLRSRGSTAATAVPGLSTIPGATPASRMRFATAAGCFVASG